MSQFSLNSSTTTGMKTAVPDYSVPNKVIDEAGGNKETYYDNPNWSKYLGYFKTIPEFRQAIISLATWTIGKGWETDPRTEVILEHITGWGEDSFQSIMENLIVMKKVNGDAFAEIIRDAESGTLINLKPLNPSNVRIVVNQKGLIERYDIKQADGTFEKFQPEEIFHLCNDRIANEIHGTSVLEACKWVIDARNEAMSDKRRVHHRSTIRVIEVETDDTARLTSLKTQYAEAIKNGEVLILPKGQAGFVDAPINYIDTQEWIQYLENCFYQAVGVPKVIAGATQDYSEASSKVGYLTFDPVYTREQKLLEEDLWAQLQIDVTFNRPAELGGVMQQSEMANTGQTGFQPNEVTAQIGKNE